MAHSQNPDFPRNLTRQGSRSSISHSGFETKFLQLGLILIIYSISKAGLFESEAFLEQLRLGYVAGEADLQNSLAVIGTIGSLLSSVIALFVLKSIRITSAPICLYIGITVYILISSAWSHVFYETLYAVIKDIIYIAATVQIIRSLSYQHIINALFIACAAIGVPSFYLSISDSVFSTSLGAEGWRGLFSHKNGLAGFCLFMIILISPSLFIGARQLVAKTCIGMLLVLLFSSKGTTSTVMSLIYLLFVTVGYWILSGRRARSKSHYQAIIIAMAAAIGVATVVAAFFITEGYITFTGRTHLWAYFLDQSSDARIFGIGGYSLKLDPYIASQAAANVGLSSPDSSLVLILFNWGIVGISLYLGLIAACVRHYSRYFSAFSLFGIGGLIAYAAYGAMESDAHFGASLSLAAVITQTLLAQKLHDAEKRVSENTV